MNDTEQEIYLDNGATTAVSAHSAQKIMDMLLNNYGNPSSLHAKGLQAQREMDKARKTVAKQLGAADTELVFTSGGTEANNLALLGAAHARRRIGKRIVTSAIEHASVLDSCRQLEEEGFEVIYLAPNPQGVVEIEDLQNAINTQTILVSFMYVNNETGALQPVDKIKRIIKQKNAPAVLHCDAVQAFGKIPFTVNSLNVDLLTATAHKLHGPKGVGVLYVSKDVRILPIHFGGSQERNLRPGTEAVSLICGFGSAVQEIDFAVKQHIEVLSGYLREQLTQFDWVKLHSDEACLPYIINFSVLGIRSETMLHFLAGKGIYVSSGSACAKGKGSHVLKAMGLPNSEVDSAIRVSFSKYNQKADIDRLVRELQNGIRTLAKR